ncbi:phytoene desaturase family protein [Egicoccus sp. AB-alg2]|uniref:phytoene desaturase family protein n=1 Tax=Egicoccus sp. AB-alg2 TaxID=3242693 RepID=UPI00359D1E29
METRPVIVVGGGLAGLTATLQLARDGVPVVAVDGSGRLGGRARSTVRGGFALNLGPHGLALGGPGTAVLRRLGIELPGHSPAVHRAQLLVDGELVGPLQRRRGAGGLRTLAAIGRMAAETRHGDPEGSVRDWLERRIPDRRARATATVVARLATYSDSLDEQGADVMAEAIRGGGVRYLDGGWGALVERLRRAALAAGAELRTGAGVQQVRRAAAGGWEVVLRDGEVLDAAAVLVAVGGPADVARLLTGQERQTVDGWAGRAAAVHMACLDVALAHRPAGHSLVLGVDEPLYLSVQSDHSRIAPAGGAVVQVARFLRIGERAPADTRACLEALLDQVLPGWRDEVVHARYLPGLTVTNDGGLAANGGRRGRPGPEVPGAPGLYVAGDWVGTRGNLSQASLVSASSAATAIAQRRAAGTTARRQQEEQAA